MFHRTDRQVHVAPGRERNDRNGAIDLAQSFDQLQAFEARRAIALIVHVDHREIGRLLLRRGERLIGRRTQGNGVAVAAKQHRQCFADMLLIFSDQDCRLVEGGSHIVSADDVADRLPTPRGQYLLWRESVKSHTESCFAHKCKWSVRIWTRHCCGYQAGTRAEWPSPLWAEWGHGPLGVLAAEARWPELEHRGETSSAPSRLSGN